MQFLILANTSMAGAPAALSKCINKYTEHSAISVLGRQFSSPDLKELKWDYDVVAPSPEELSRMLQESDVVIQNQRVWPISDERPQFMLYHAQPGSYQPEVTHPEFTGRKMVVAQYQTRFYIDAVPMPNLVDVWADEFKPGFKSEDKVNLFMGVASETNTGWGRKGSKEVQIIFKQLNSKYGNKISTTFMKGRPMDEVINAKRHADIVITDLQTGSYHRAGVEGLAYGAVTFSNIDDLCLDSLKKVTGSLTNPFVKANVHSVYKRVCAFIENKPLLRIKQLESRKWAEKYWDPKKQVQQYIKFIEERI